MNIDADRFGTVVRNGEAYDIHFERRIAKPIEKVWAAITTPERIADWFAEVQLEPRLGGAYRLRFSPEEDFVVGEITAFDPPRLLQHTWPDAAFPAATVRYELAPDGEGCRLRFSNLGVPAPYVGSLAGWHLFLDAIPGAVEAVRFVWTMEAERKVMDAYKARVPWLQALTIAARAGPLGTVTSTDRTVEIRFVRRLDRPVEMVWAALTVPERIADWFAEMKFERLAPGEAIALTFPHPHGSVEGRFEAVETNRLIAWTWPQPDGSHSTVKFELAREGDGCRLTLTESGLTGAQGVGNASGWHAHLQALAEAADGVHTPWATLIEREKAVNAIYLERSSA